MSALTQLQTVIAGGVQLLSGASGASQQDCALAMVSARALSYSQLLSNLDSITSEKRLQHDPRDTVRESTKSVCQVFSCRFFF